MAILTPLIMPLVYFNRHNRILTLDQFIPLDLVGRYLSEYYCY